MTNYISNLDKPYLNKIKNKIKEGTTFICINNEQFSDLINVGDKYVLEEFYFDFDEFLGQHMSVVMYKDVNDNVNVNTRLFLIFSSYKDFNNSFCTKSRLRMKKIKKFLDKTNLNSE